MENGEAVFAGGQAAEMTGKIGPRIYQGSLANFARLLSLTLTKSAELRSEQVGHPPHTIRVWSPLATNH